MIETCTARTMLIARINHKCKQGGARYKRQICTVKNGHIFQFYCMKVPLQLGENDQQLAQQANG